MLQKRFCLLMIMLFKIKENYINHRSWISHDNELLQDDGLQKAHCVYKYMKIV